MSLERAPRDFRRRADPRQRVMEVDRETVTVPDPRGAMRGSERTDGDPARRRSWRSADSCSGRRNPSCSRSRPAAARRRLDEHVDVGVVTRAPTVKQQLIERRPLEEDRLDPGGGERRRDACVSTSSQNVASGLVLEKGACAGQGIIALSRRDHSVTRRQQRVSAGEPPARAGRRSRSRNPRR